MEAKEILDTMLGYLGFVAEIHEVETESGHQLQIFTAESEALIGPEGETLEDLQFLLNRILQAQDRNAPRVQVDVGHWRAMRDDKLRQRIRQIADTVRISAAFSRSCFRRSRSSAWSTMKARSLSAVKSKG